MQRFKRHLFEKYGTIEVQEFVGRSIPRRMHAVKHPLQCPMFAATDGRFDYGMALSPAGAQRHCLAIHIGMATMWLYSAAGFRRIAAAYRREAAKAGFRLP